MPPKFELALLVRDPESNMTAKFRIDSPELVEMAREGLLADLPNVVSMGSWHGGILHLKKAQGEYLLAAEPPLKKIENPDGEVMGR
jgi:hypothetical protein